MSKKVTRNDRERDLCNERLMNQKTLSYLDEKKIRTIIKFL